jgi:hypothetical protein
LLQKQVLPVYPQQSAGQSQSLHEENGTYGVTKHLVHTEQGPGRVRRVSAAVVVNDRSVTEGVGKTAHMAWKPRSAEEMRRLEELAQAAVGYDARRGDQVVMQNVSFSTNAPEVKPPVMDKLMEETRGLLHTQPGLLRTAVIGLRCAWCWLCFGDGEPVTRLCVSRAAGGGDGNASVALPEESTQTTRQRRVFRAVEEQGTSITVGIFTRDGTYSPSQLRYETLEG